MPRAGTHGPASFSSARFDHGTRRRTYPVTVPARPSEREVDEFLTRAMSQVIVKEDLAKQLRSGERQLRIKQGFDPTHPNLHIGHAVPLRKLRRFAEWGRELQEQVGQPPQSVFINQLLEGLDGEKMSKSKPATAIWLTDPPNDVYGKVMSIEDKLMSHYFEWATELPMPEVQAILRAIAANEL